MKKKRLFEKLMGFIVGTFLYVMPISAQQNASAVSPLSPLEVTGKKLFFQRCSLCHLPPLGRPASARSFGPPLKGYSNTPDRGARIAGVIRKGTGRMPGFQYGLSDSEIEAIASYVKTFH